MPKLLSSKLKCPPMGHVTRKRGEVWEVLVLYIICERRRYVNARWDKKFTSLKSASHPLVARFISLPSRVYPYQLVFDEEPHCFYT